MKKKVDPRVVRTRKLLIDGMVSIILEEGYDKLTVKRIVKKAGVNRSTFYLHFLDKQDIIEQMEKDMLFKLKKSLEFPTYDYKNALHLFTHKKMPIKSHISMFEHIYQYKELYKYLLKERSFHIKFTETIKKEVLKFQDRVWDATFMANGATGIILHWLESEKEETIEDMSLWLTNVILLPLGKFN